MQLRSLPPQPRNAQTTMAATTTVLKPTLTFFNKFGRAEAARLILEDSGVDYDWVGFGWSNWPELKAQLTAAGECPLPPQLSHRVGFD
jgi:hypothetical protein